MYGVQHGARKRETGEGKEARGVKPAAFQSGQSACGGRAKTSRPDTSCAPDSARDNADVTTQMACSTARWDMQGACACVAGGQRKRAPAWRGESKCGKKERKARRRKARDLEVGEVPLIEAFFGLGRRTDRQGHRVAAPDNVRLVRLFGCCRRKRGDDQSR